MKCLGASQLRQISQDIHAPTLTYFFPGDTSDLRPCLMSYSCSGYLGLCQTLCTSLRVCSFRWKHSDLEEQPDVMMGLVHTFPLHLSRHVQEGPQRSS